MAQVRTRGSIIYDKCRFNLLKIYRNICIYIYTYIYIYIYMCVCVCDLPKSSSYNQNIFSHGIPIHTRSDQYHWKITSEIGYWLSPDKFICSHSDTRVLKINRIKKG